MGCRMKGMLGGGPSLRGERCCGCWNTSTQIEEQVHCGLVVKSRWRLSIMVDVRAKGTHVRSVRVFGRAIRSV